MNVKRSKVIGWLSVRALIKAFSIILLSCIFVAVSAGDAYAKRCRGAPTPILQFIPTVSKTKYNISESAFSLSHAGGGAAGGGLTLGLASAPIYYKFDTQFLRVAADGGYCIAIDKMKFYYAARPVVWISSEFPRGSCEFNAVLFHENKHVNTLKKVHARNASKFEEHVHNAMERIRPEGPVQANQVPLVQEKMLKDFRFILDEHIEDIYYELRREQTKVDSPSEYERVNAECDGWNKRLRYE